MVGVGEDELGLLFGLLFVVVVVTGVDGVDADEVSDPSVAVTENVYSVLAVRPLTTQLVLGADTVQVRPPGSEVTV
jgi:hypothetical protein